MRRGTRPPHPSIRKRVRTRKGVQMQAFQERLMGFEASTFCMASSCWGSVVEPLYLCESSTSHRGSSKAIPRLSPASHGSLWTECGPERGGGRQREVVRGAHAATRAHVLNELAPPQARFLSRESRSRLRRSRPREGGESF